MSQTNTRWRPLVVVGVVMITLFACVGGIAIGAIAAFAIRDNAERSYSYRYERESEQVTPAPASTRQADGTGTAIHVVSTELAFTLDTTRADAGAVTFVVKNDGHIAHDFSLEGNGVHRKTPMIQPGGSAEFMVKLGPGTYEYMCTVPGHAMAGMRGTFTVTPAGASQ